MPINTVHQLKVNSAYIEIRRVDYEPDKSITAIKKLAQEYAKPEDAALRVDVIKALKDLIDSRLVAAGREPVPEISTALTEILTPQSNYGGVQLISNRNSFSGTSPVSSDSLRPPPYNPNLTSGMAGLSMGSITRTQSVGSRSVPTNAHAAPTTISPTGFQPTAFARELISLYDGQNDKVKATFNEVKERKCRIVVQDPIGESAEQIDESWDALFITVHIALERRGAAGGILVRFFNDKTRPDYEINSMADLQAMITSHPLKERDPPDLSGNMDKVLWDYLRNEVKGHEDLNNLVPLSCYLICDGTDNDLPVTILKDSVGALHDEKLPSKQWGIQAIQVGDKEEGTETLAELDDNKFVARDQMDTIKFSEINTIEGLQKMMLGGFNRRYDKKPK